MKYIREFAKIYQVKIPVERYHEYYINTLTQSREFSSLRDQIALFQSIPDDPGRLKEKSMKQLIDILSKSAAYKSMLEAKAGERRPEKGIDNRDGYFLSIDIQKANWSVLRSFDKEELPTTWQEFCLSHGIHPALIESKAFRQHIFGHLSPKQAQRLQAASMTTLSRALEEKGYTIAAFTDDEVTIHGTGDGIQPVLDEFAYTLKTTLFKLQKLAADRHIKTIYKEDHEYKTLMGIPGNEFFLHFKHYILGQPLDEKDLYFEQDKRVCKWLELPPYMQDVSIPVSK